MEILTLNRQIIQQHQSQYFTCLGAQVTRDMEEEYLTSRKGQVEYASLNTLKKSGAQETSAGIQR